MNSNSGTDKLFYKRRKSFNICKKIRGPNRSPIKSCKAVNIKPNIIIFISQEKKVAEKIVEFDQKENVFFFAHSDPQKRRVWKIHQDSLPYAPQIYHQHFFYQV